MLPSFGGAFLPLFFFFFSFIRGVILGCVKFVTMNLNAKGTTNKDTPRVEDFNDSSYNLRRVADS